MSASPDDKVLDAVDGGVAARRRRAHRTAIVFGAVAFTVYVGFILSGVLAQ